MSIFKDVTQTVKNIFNADDDMMFEEENDFKEQTNTSFPKMPFSKNKNQDKLFQINGGKSPSFDMSSHGFDMAQSGVVRKNRSNGKIQVYVPKSFEEAFGIIKDVKSGFTAMVNVEVANPQISQRIIDVISGAIYALDGECKKMGEKQYIFSLSAETIGAYDYLPTSGATAPQMNGYENQGGYSFGMGNPFSFLNQNSMQQQGMNEPSYKQNNFNIQNANQSNVMPTPTDYSRFYVPPKSQF